MGGKNAALLYAGIVAQVVGNELGRRQRRPRFMYGTRLDDLARGSRLLDVRPGGRREIFIAGVERLQYQPRQNTS